ncbi:MAG: hypothetical protein K8R88_01935 [Armatimonadetes bacterium]|nr:hypothetical protein [Armatimonadota bacterium]
MKSLLSIALLLGFTSISFAQKDIVLEEVEGVDPPRPRPIELTSPPMNILARGGISIYQVNVNAAGQNIIGDAANEPSLTVDPSNPNRIAAGWRQFASITSNFREGGYGWSTDGGVTWQADKHTPGLFRSDPVLETTSAGVFHYNSLQQTFFSDEFRSSNYGASYSLLGPATGGDKQWIAIDKTTLASNGNIYQWWSTAGNNYSGRQFSRSIDVTPNMSGDIINGRSINPGGLAGQMSCVADTGNGPTAGNVYMMGTLQRDVGSELDVMFVRSSNQGVSFSPAVRINDDPAGQGHSHWFGTLAVAPNGRLDAIWFDTRIDASKIKSAPFYSYSLNGGTTWSANEQIAPMFDPLIGWPQQNKIGDYIGVLSTNNFAQCIFPATWNGEQDVYFARIPAPDILVQGNIIPADWSITRAGLVATISVYDAANNLKQTASATLDAAGHYQFALDQNLAHLSLKIKVKLSHWLRKTVYNGTVGLAGLTTATQTLINGDVDNGNEVDLTDYTQLLVAFNATVVDGNWNPSADLNGDGIVDLTDYTVLVFAFNGVGD